MFSKLQYYFFLAMKKPYLIPRLIYKKHLGIIISIPIVEIELPNNKKSITINKSTDIGEISCFYKKMNRDSVSAKKVEEWLNDNFDCFLVKTNEKVTIGAMWVFKNEFILSNLSGRTLSSERILKFDEDSIYGALVIIDRDYRGKGINQYLLNYVVRYYSKTSEYKKMIVITGASNGAYIRATMKINSKLIGIIQVRNILGMKFRKELFLDRKEKSWG